MLASTAGIVAGVSILASGQAYAADEPSVADLKAEIARLRDELQAAKQNKGAPQAASDKPAPAPTAPVAASTPPTPTEAQGDTAKIKPVALDAVVITSRNREEIAQDVPLPVQVIGGAQLERDDAKTVWDLQNKAPNLRISPPGENARKVSISIRGVGRNGANDSAEGSVGVIVDGVALYYAGQAWSDYVDLDRIEVLRGPQGTLMGKNTTLGALNIITKAPSFTPASSFELNTGGLDSLGGKFSATGPLVDGKLAYRSTFVVDRANGLYTNTYQSQGAAKETWNEANRLAGRLQLLWTPSDDVSGRFIFDKLRSDERTNVSFLWDNGPATWSDGVTRPTVTAPAGYTGSYTNYGYLGKFAQRAAWFHNADGSIYQPTLGSTNFGNSEARPQVTNQQGTSAQFDWRLPNHTLTSITAYRYQDFDIKNGGNYDQFYIGNGGQQLWNRQVSQEIRLASNPAPDKKLDYQVGAYYLNARVYSDDPTYYGPDAGAWNASTAQYNTLIGTAAGRELMRASLDGIYQSSVTDARVRSLAGYGQTDWHITDKATFTSGLRVTEEHKSNRISQQLDRPGPNLAALGATLGASAAEISAANGIRSSNVNTPFDFVNGEQIDSQLTAWNLGPSYKLNDDVLLYSSVGKGVKSGIVTWTSTTSQIPSNLQPEKSLDYELGFKSLLLDRKLQFNLNLYQTKITDYQTQVSVLQSDGVTYKNVWTNAPGVKARGIELESAYQVNRELSVSANGAINQARYHGEFRVATPDVDTSLPAYAGAAGTTDLNGKQLYNAPKRSLNLGANYLTPIGGYLGRVTLSNSYVSGTYLAVNQAAFSYQKAYNITNLGIGLGSLDRKWEVSIIAKNLFNTFYAVNRGTYSSTGAESLNLGAPRFWGLTFRSKL
jgi:iron complex outermembrane receptor protein